MPQYRTSQTFEKSMHLPPLTRQQSRQVDLLAIEEYGMSGLVLMENAGRGAAEKIDTILATTRISAATRPMILCGQGNNAGDGYVIARHLQLLGREVEILSVVELSKLSGDAEANANIARRAEIPIRVITDPDRLADVIGPAPALIDCLLGTGAKGNLREPYRAAVQAANNAARLRIAIDVPTGLDCDSGVPGTPTFQADHSITFVSSKIGFAQPAAEPYVGHLHVIGIGVPRKLLVAIQQQ